MAMKNSNAAPTVAATTWVAHCSSTPRHSNRPEGQAHGDGRVEVPTRDVAEGVNP